MVLGFLAAEAAPPDAASASGAIDVALEAAASVGWVAYRDLWVGDPVLGGFDADASPFLADGVVARAALRLAVVPNAEHRFLLRLDTRSLQRLTALTRDGTLEHVVTSDGIPLEAAVRERAFVDEASWRYRPTGDRALEVALGILPFDIARGRFLAESWPGVRLGVDGGRWGGPPLAGVARLAVTPRGAVEGAVRLERTWSAFDALGIEVAVLSDPDGLAPLIEQDPGLLLGVLGAVNQPFVEEHGPEFAEWIGRTYLTKPYGLPHLHADAAEYLALYGEADVAFLSLLGDGVVGGWKLSAAATGSVGWGHIGGNKLPAGTGWEEPPADWPEVAPKEDWSAAWRLRAFAFDLAAERLGGAVRPFAFAQGASGDPDLVDTARAEQPIHAFLAPDQAFLRTRVFPIDATRLGGAWGFPPGVGTTGIIAVGGGASLGEGRVRARAQLAIPWSWVPVCTGCDPGAFEPRRHQGEEGDLTVSLALPRVSPLAEVGGLVPGAFFLDDSDPARDQVGELPIGWRVYAGVVVGGGP